MKLQRKAKHDSLIFELLKNEDFRIHENGSIEKRIRKWDKEIRKELWAKCTRKDGAGYLYVRFQKKNVSAHRIVFAKFNGFLRSDKVVNHKDGNKTNNNVLNLELISESQNQIHSYKHLHNRYGRSKLSWTQVEEIRKLWGTKEYTQTKIAERYGVHKGSISRIVNDVCYSEKEYANV